MLTNFNKDQMSNSQKTARKYVGKWNLTKIDSPVQYFMCEDRVGEVTWC